MTHSIVMRSKTGTVRVIEAHHNWDLKMSYEQRGAY
jgi:fructose-1,6-bisphosphatase II / sedoheptulose-1,7-bisphosphatase